MRVSLPLAGVLAFGVHDRILNGLRQLGRALIGTSLGRQPLNPFAMIGVIPAFDGLLGDTLTAAAGNVVLTAGQFLGQPFEFAALHYAGAAIGQLFEPAYIVVFVVIRQFGQFHPHARPAIVAYPSPCIEHYRQYQQNPDDNHPVAYGEICHCHAQSARRQFCCLFHVQRGLPPLLTESATLSKTGCGR